MNARHHTAESAVDQAIRRRRQERMRDWTIFAVALCVALAAGMLRHRAL